MLFNAMIRLFNIYFGYSAVQDGLGHDRLDEICVADSSILSVHG